ARTPDSLDHTRALHLYTKPAQRRENPVQLFTLRDVRLHKRHKHLQVNPALRQAPITLVERSGHFIEVDPLDPHAMQDIRMSIHDSLSAPHTPAP
ncbi:MAG: hypothetical protein ACYCOU_23080, partial [Sulfobacillus sp.]